MKLTGLLVIILLAAGCSLDHNDSISGNGRIKTGIISTDTITDIIISDKLDLTIVPSDDSTFVLLSADENLHDVIRVSVVSGQLKISSDKSIRMARSKEVKVYGNLIRRIDASSKSTVTTRDSLRCDDFTLITSSAAEVHIYGVFRTLYVNGSSASSIMLEGRTENLNINASSAADIFAFDMQAVKVDVVASSMSDVRVTTRDNAHFSASSGADIKYKGNPAIINTEASSMGDIHQVRF